TGRVRSSPSGSEILFNRPAAAGRPDRAGQRRGRAGGDGAVVKGQLAGGQVAADEQVVTRGGGGQPGPGVPALALGAAAGRADLPAAPGGQQRGGGLLAGQPDAAGRGEIEVRRNPQHVGLAAGFQELAQPGAAAVDLIAAGEVQADTVSEDL